MTINVLELVVIIILAILAWWVNEQHGIPVLHKVCRVLIVVVAVLALMGSLGLIGWAPKVR